MLTCANDGCDMVFEPKTHNQKFHSDECCRIATNKRIMEKYYARRDQRQGKTRWCKDCGTTRLSRYNDSLTCSGCAVKNRNAISESVPNMINNITLVY